MERHVTLLRPVRLRGRQRRLFLLCHGIARRADIYATGCVAYWLLTGQLVFYAPTPIGLLMHHTWLTAGAGVANISDERSFKGEAGSALVALGSLQYRSVVVSTRLVRASASPTTGWDLGLLAGLGSSLKYPVHGSIAAGLGRVESGLGQAGVTFPVELQLGWRLGPTVGAGIYAFGSFGGPAEFLGATLALQIGRLR